MDARVKPEHDGCVCGTGSAISSFVMPGLEPGIHGLPSEEGSGGSLARLRMTEGAASADKRWMLGSSPSMTVVFVARAVSFPHSPCPALSRASTAYQVKKE